MKLHYSDARSVSGLALGLPPALVEPQCDWPVEAWRTEMIGIKRVQGGPGAKFDVTSSVFGKIGTAEVGKPFTDDPRNGKAGGAGGPSAGQVGRKDLLADGGSRPSRRHSGKLNPPKDYQSLASHTFMCSSWRRAVGVPPTIMSLRTMGSCPPA
jgi:hypothetical protein